jgi:uncharacterized membrane protein
VKKAISFALFLPILMAIGAQLGTVISPLILIGVIATVIILVAKDKIKGKVIYFYIFGMSLGLLYQTTMMGLDVVGSDIHTEFYFAQLNAKQAWDITYPDSSNSSIVIGLLVPMISKLTGLEVLWVIKAIMPIFLACVPVVLFATFKKLFGWKKAFFSTIFFMIVPIFSLEIAQIVKSMVAELFWVIGIYALLSDWKWYWKLPVISGTLALQIMSHYTVGILGICFYLCVFGFRLIAYLIKWWSVKKTHIVVIGLSLLIGMCTFYFYHSYAANGSAWRSIYNVAASYLPLPQSDKTEIVKGSHEGIMVVKEPVAKADITGSLEQRIEKSPTLVKLGVGADFVDSPWDGKLFRILQYLTQFMILLGGIQLLRKYKVPNEYLGLVGGSLVLLLLCILIPSISIIINMSRYYHFSLLFIAPLFVLGCEFVGGLRCQKGNMK